MYSQLTGHGLAILRHLYADSVSCVLRLGGTIHYQRLGLLFDRLCIGPLSMGMGSSPTM